MPKNWLDVGLTSFGDVDGRRRDTVGSMLSPDDDVAAPIGLYRENAIAIESEANDSFGGNVYYVTMQITLPIP